MPTSENSPEPNLSPLTSSAEDIPASHSAKPGSAQASPTCGIFGPGCSASFAYFDPATSSWKTSQGTFLSDLEQFSETWPDAGTMRNGSVYELQTSGPATSASGCSLWPTAVGQDSKHAGPTDWEKQNHAKKGYLHIDAATWKAPSTEDHKTDGPRALGRYGTDEMRTCDRRLRNQAQTWPTARQEDGESCGNHPGAVDSPTGAARGWPTPQAHDATGPRGKNNVYSDHHYKPHDLAMATDTWRTPDAGGPRNRQGSIGAGHQITIAEQAEHWQTPATDSFRSRGGERKDEMGLDQQARMFPTPASRDYRTPNKRTFQERSGTTKGEQLQNFVEHHLDSPPAPPTPDGPPSSESVPTSRRRLNPRFVEWLMGFPIGHTEP